MVADAPDADEAPPRIDAKTEKGIVIDPARVPEEVVMV
jgi:hypothetical protein